MQYLIRYKIQTILYHAATCVFRLNFSDAEIELFVAQYDADGNELLDVDEINAVERGIIPMDHVEK